MEKIQIMHDIAKESSNESFYWFCFDDNFSLFRDYHIIDEKDFNKMMNANSKPLYVMPAIIIERALNKRKEF